MKDVKEPAHKIPCKRQGLQVREIDGEVVILDPRTDQMHNLNPTAAFIFEAVDGARTAAAIALEVARCYEIDVALAEKDTLALLEQLRGLQLIE